MRKAIAVLALVLGMGSSLCAQDAILSVMAEKSGIIAHVKVLEIEGGFVDEEGVTEWHALCEVVEPMKGDFKKKDKIQFHFTIFDYKEKKEPVRVEKDGEYIIFLESKVRGGYRFLSQDKMGATHELVDRWLGVMKHEHYLAERLTKYILPDQAVKARQSKPDQPE